MKPKYKVIAVYFILSFILFIFIIGMPGFIKVQYQEVVISEPITIKEGRSAVSIKSVKDGKNITYQTTCRRLNNGEPIKRGRHYYKNFCGNISNIDNVIEYKKITSIYGVNIDNSNDLFVKQINYIDVNDNNISFKIADNLVNKYLKEQLISLWIMRAFFIFGYIFAPIYFYRKSILKPFKSFFNNQTKGN